MVRDRSAREPEGKAGIADLLHRMLPRGTRLSDRGQLKAGLRGDILRVGRAGTTPLLRGVWSRGNRVA